MRAALWPDCDDHDGEIEAVLSDAWAPYAVLVAERPSGGLGGFVEVGERSYAEGAEHRPVGYVEGWWVDDDMRGAGVGRALVDAAADWALSSGYRDLCSDAEIDNEASIAAHRALGFAEVDRIACFHRSLDD